MAKNMTGMSPSPLAQMRMSWTVSGSSPRARSMRSRSSARKRSASPSELNLTRNLTLPWLERLKTSSRSGSVRSCSSIGRATLSAFSWGELPGCEIHTVKFVPCTPPGNISSGRRR